MARFFLGVTLFTLLALCIACGGVPATPTTTSSVQEPRDSAAVDREISSSSPSGSQLENDSAATTSKENEDRQASQSANPYLPQIIDWMERGKPELHLAVGEIGRVPHLEAIQVIDGNSCLCRVGRSGQVVVLHDLSTSGMVDGHEFGVKLARVSGTTQYENVLGSTNTVFVLHAMGTDEAETAMLQQSLEKQRLAEEAEREKLAEIERRKEQLRESQFRKWKSADGQFEIEARLEYFTAGTAKLERRDGIVVDVPEGKLSDDDQLYIKEEFQRRAKAARELRRMER